MKINVSDISSKQPYKVKTVDSIDVPECFGLSEKLVDVFFSGYFIRNDGRFVLEGILTARVPALCALCLNESFFEVNCNVKEVFLREPDDVDDWPVIDNAVTLTPVFRSILLSALPQRVLCMDNCKGLCPSCGQNLNISCCSCS